MTIRTIRKIIFIVLVVQLVLVRRVPPSPSSPQIVSPQLYHHNCTVILTLRLDAKQARDLVNILQESKQQIDPRLSEMGRYSGGGGGGRWGGRGGGRGRGGGGGGFTASNSAPLGRSRW